MAPRIDQVNLVVGDVVGAAQFLAGLGIDMATIDDEWAAHHRGIPIDGTTFDVELDSNAFAKHWGGLDPTFNGLVLTVRVDERDKVDRLYALARSIGGRSRKAPYDAFWGSRFALVDAPGPLLVGLMSERDDAYRSAPPDPATFS